MYIPENIVQYEPAWWEARLGIPTASAFNKIITATGKPSDQAQKYMYQLATEQVTGVYAGNDYQNKAMERGHEMETHARTLFEMAQGVEVKQVGLCYSDEQKKYAMSPDGLLDEAGLEIYCPESPAAVYCLLNPDKAIAHAKKFQQIQGSLLISEFEKWWFEMYYPGLPPLFLEVRRDEVFIAKLKAELDKFCVDLALTVRKLKDLG